MSCINIVQVIFKLSPITFLKNYEELQKASFCVDNVG